MSLQKPSLKFPFLLPNRFDGRNGSIFHLYDSSNVWSLPLNLCNQLFNALSALHERNQFSGFARFPITAQIIVIHLEEEAQSLDFVR